MIAHEVNAMITKMQQRPTGWTIKHVLAFALVLFLVTASVLVYSSPVQAADGWGCRFKSKYNC